MRNAQKCWQESITRDKGDQKGKAVPVLKLYVMKTNGEADV
jgi:hypothetical protein